MDEINLSDTHTETPEKATEELKWYAMRDLKRVNSKNPAYLELADKGFEVFTPMRWVIRTVKGKRKRLKVPVLTDLLFVHSYRKPLDTVVDKVPTLQYRYARGGYCVPIVIRDDEMMRFIKATSMSNDPKYYTEDEITKLSIGKTVRILGGPMDGIEAKIVNVRGARHKRILVNIPSLIAAVVEVDSEYIEIID